MSDNLNLPRRKALKKIGAGMALGASGLLSAPAFAQNKPLKIGVIAPVAESRARLAKAASGRWNGRWPNSMP